MFDDVRSDSPNVDTLRYVYESLVEAVIHTLSAACTAAEDDEAQLTAGLAEVSDLIVDKLFILTVWLHDNGASPDNTRLIALAHPLRERLLQAQR